jgi:cell wall-associated NlpC family hydrolase
MENTMRMNKAFRLMLCLPLVAGVSLCARLRAEAQSSAVNWIRAAVPETAANSNSARLPQLPEVKPAELQRLVFGNFTTLPLPALQPGLPQLPFAFAGEPVTMLQGAILKRLGIRYKFTGSDDRGYDCSGFVWRVFRDAGAEFERVAARTLWHQLPEVSGIEARQFGTLVFFNGLKHIGIVRDAETFYHSSRSHGVTISTFAGYWGKRITGFRRSPVPILPPPPDALKPAE